ncbi:threonine aldolase [Oxalobacteraceae bacterium CAVE-383]|nr:threonine aldolase [Oxalobacteraceae bacterium CAVE-383]
MIDLRSDTLTKLTRRDVADLDYEKIGDDCYGEDRYVRELEAACCRLFGKEAALFMPSGTMSNQIGLRCLAARGREVITETGYHVNFFESSQVSALSGIVLHPFHSQDGVLRAADIRAAIASKARGSALYSLPDAVSLESSINTYGGLVYPHGEMVRVRGLCDETGMALYMDGARILNSCVSAGIDPDRYAAPADMLNFCFSKGLGAPFGSMLMGSRGHIEQARIFRKWYGGCLHQSGLMAGIALHRLRNWRAAVQADNELAGLLGAKLQEAVPLLHPVQTNMVYIRVPDAARFVDLLLAEGVRCTAWTGDTVRFVTSNLHGRADILRAAEAVCRATAAEGVQ